MRVRDAEGAALLSVELAERLGQLRREGDVTEGGPVLYRFPSRSRPGVTYTLAELNGQYDCDCPSPYNTPTETNCIHAKTVRKAKAMTNNLPTVRELTNLDTGLDIVPEGYQPLELRPPNRLPSKPEFEMMQSIAETVFAAPGMVPDNIKTPQAALAIMLAGHELGMPPMTALRRVFLVNGKTELESQALMGLVRAYDPTARFVFHRYDQEGADVEIFRGGRSMLRCSYTQADRDISKQGYKRRGQWKTSQNGKRYFEPQRENGQLVYDIDEESYWHKYPRDAYAYNAVKRCCRLGASDCINQIGGFTANAQPAYIIDQDTRAVGDEDEAPKPQLTEALIKGEAKPEQVFGDNGPEDTGPNYADAPPHEDPGPPPLTGAPLSDAPTDILAAIERKQGAEGKREATGAFTRMFGTSQLLKLKAADVPLCAAMLKVRLEGTAHDHDADVMMGPGGHYLCRLCGAIVEPPAAGSIDPDDVPFSPDEAPEEPAAGQPSLMHGEPA